VSVRHDRNYRSWDGGGDDPPDFDLILDPVADGWREGSWSDTAKFYQREDQVYRSIQIVIGGAEDCVDVGSKTNRCEFIDFVTCSGGQYHLTLKGGSSDNLFANWYLYNSGDTVDIEIGNWSSSDFTKSQRNTFDSWRKFGDKPVTYCYRLGCKPLFINTKAKHLLFRSIGLTVYWWSKFFLHNVLKVSDK